MNLFRERWINGLDALEQHGWFQMRHEEAMRLRTHLHRTLRLAPSVIDRNASRARSTWPRASRKIWWILWFTDGAVKDLLWNACRYGNEVTEKVMVVLDGLSWIGRRMSRPRIVKVGRDRRHSKSDVLGFSKERNQNNGRKNRCLRGDGDD